MTDVLQQQFGALISSSEVRRLLKFNSASSFWMARRRGHLELKPKKIAGRREHMFLTEDVAHVLHEWRHAA